MSKPQLTARLTVSLVLRKDDKVLVLHEPDDAGVMRYNLPGGHVELGEGIPEAAVREAQEETGLNIALGQLILIISSTWEDGTSSIRQIFEGKIKGGSLKPESGSQIKWLTEQEVSDIADTDFTFGSKKAISLSFQQKQIPTEHVLMRDKGIEKKWIE